MEKAIVAEGLTKYYGDVVGVEDLDLEVLRGEIFGFLGPNGAGKTTTMRLLMGLLMPTRGSASILGMDCWKQSVAVNEITGYLPGDVSLYSKLTGEQMVRFIAGFDRGDEKDGLELASRLDLELDRKVRDFSRGMLQKMGLVITLMKKPPILIMDEPTISLDPITQHVLYEILEEHLEDGATILFSSHNLAEVERICERVGIIRKGHMVATERMEDLRAKRLRHVEISFAEEIPEGLAGFPGVTEFERSANRAIFKFRGDVNPLLEWLSGHRVSDISITHASLEDVFLEFYGPTGGGEGA